MLRLILVLPLLALLGCQVASQKQSATPWNLRSLGVPPKADWGARSNLIQEVYYEGEPFHGKPTRVFAYVGRPEGQGPFPGVVLVHGGGGKAFRDWAEHWARRGYVSIAMDTAGNGPNGRLPDGGPDQNDTVKFRNFTPSEIPDMWTYHAVAAAIRGHSLLRSLPEVDPARTAVTGISWGGYLTCILAGVDPRFKAAVPVYGCGFLGDNSVWKPGSLAKMDPEARSLWLATFDPSRYLPAVRCPILFLNGTHDFAYPLDSHHKSGSLVRPSLRFVTIVPKLPHGHIWTFPEVDQFIDRALRREKLPRLSAARLRNGRLTAQSNSPLAAAQLHYTTDTGPWDKRTWHTLPAALQKSPPSIQVDLPPELHSQTNLHCLLLATTPDGLRLSSELISFVPAACGGP